jgi:nitronate monooxygenase
LKQVGIRILSSATSVEEARWLEVRGCDAVIAQGSEAGGHRGMFLSEDISQQTGTLSLVSAVASAVQIPVIAAGGIADPQGIVAALAAGASAIQLGTAYLLCPEVKISKIYRDALKGQSPTALTNVFSGRPARGLMNRFVREMGPLSELAPPFPLASVAVAPLRKRSEELGSSDFLQMWAGESFPLCREMPARELTQYLASETLARLV